MNIIQLTDNEMDQNFGIIIIINNKKLPYGQLLNNKAFLKNSNGKKFFELDNVSEFYQSLLGGIEPLHDLIFEYGSDKNDIFDGLFEKLTDEDNINIIEDIAKKVKKN